MKVVILAGGFGTRITEESATKPKPMVEIGGRPILWHIMKIYSHYGLTDFIICLGYKGYVIKKYFADYFLSMSDVRFELRDKQVEVPRTTPPNRGRSRWWTLAKRPLPADALERVKDYLGDETFCLTYGDGVADLNIPKVIEFHREQKDLATFGHATARPLRSFHAAQGPKATFRTLHRKAEWGWRLGQRRILCPRTQSDSTTSTAT